MAKTVIKVENLSKLYDLGLVGTGTLSRDLNRAWARLFGKPDPYAKLADLNDRTSISKSGSVWALKDLNFSVQEGEVLGIIGKNGAGKSTLLKVLSQITAPTTGSIKVRGRIASLLEVGTGMHPEMTAQQNIYLNGSIMGMTRNEVSSKFDEIVDFAGIAKYISTPIKRFSSGMQVRLGFAVAAFLEPEILIVDEVLAVGDAEFQRKAIGKMQDVSQNAGRTVLFVSHNMEAVLSLCRQGMLIEQGGITYMGDVKEALTFYTTKRHESARSWDDSNRPGDRLVRLNKVLIIDKCMTQVEFVDIRESFGVCVEFEVMENGIRPTPNFHFFSKTNTLCFVAIAEEVTLDRGFYKSVTWIPGDLLNNQIYRIGVAITSLKNLNIHLYEKDVIEIEITENRLERIDAYGGEFPGILRPKFESEIIKL